MGETLCGESDEEHAKLGQFSINGGTMIDIIGSVGGVIGCIIVSRGKALEANMVWCVSNLLMVAYFWSIGEMAAFTMFVVYEIIAVYGVWNLMKQKRAAHQKV